MVSAQEQGKSGVEVLGARASVSECSASLDNYRNYSKKLVKTGSDLVSWSGSQVLSVSVLRETLWSASSLPSVRCCGKPLRSDCAFPVIRSYRGRKYIGNLSRCNSRWACPACSYRLSREDKRSVARAMRAGVDMGVSLYFMTMTMGHRRGQDLASLWGMLSRAWNSVSSLVRQRDLFGILGWVKAVEVTYSGLNGWHVHLHVLLFAQKGMSVCLSPAQVKALKVAFGEDLGESKDFLDSCAMSLYADTVFGHWKTALHKLGGNASRQGFDIRRVTRKPSRFEDSDNNQASRNSDIEAVATYLTKLGLESVYGVEDEITNMVSKKGRGQVSRTMLQILQDMTQNRTFHRLCVNKNTEVNMLDNGSVEIRNRKPGYDDTTDWVFLVTKDQALWNEYEQVSKGKHRFDWSGTKVKHLPDQLDALTGSRLMDCQWRQILDAKNRAEDMLGEEQPLDLCPITYSEWEAMTKTEGAYQELLNLVQDSGTNTQTVQNCLEFLNKTRTRFIKTRCKETIYRQKPQKRRNQRVSRDKRIQVSKNQETAQKSAATVTRGKTRKPRPGKQTTPR